MPELPEVEVVRNTLNQNLCGRKIINIECFYPPIIENINEFIPKVLGHEIIRIDRYAKYLIFVLDDGLFLSHLRMEGKYFYVDNAFEVGKHQHVIFYLDNGHKLIYQDVRKFGRIVYKKQDELMNTPPLSKLGPEANNLNISIEEIFRKTKRSSLPIKTLLLDQSFISGLGNIYADEVLFQAGVSPLRKASTLTKKDVSLLLSVSQEILRDAIEHQGTTIRSYTSSLGVEGKYQNYLKVHTKEFCPKCLKEIQIIKIGGRSSYFCKNCQR